MLSLKKIIEQRYILLVFVLFVFLVVVGYFVASNSIDPDFGWHLKSGQLILEKGVPKTDWYSYTMPNFPWINHEWLADVFIYKIYSFFGYQFLMSIFLAIFSLAFIILIKKKLILCFLFPVVLGYLASLGFLGIRPQFITVLFTAIILTILDKFFDNFKTKLIYFLPILFLVWANLHSGFIIGLLLIFLYLLLETFRKTKLFNKIISLKFLSGQNLEKTSNKKIKILAIIFIVSVVFTFINPYGVRPYGQIFSVLGDSFLKSHIIEWMPLFTTSDIWHSIFIILYIGFFVGLLLVFYRKIYFDKLIISLLFLYFAVSSQRNLLIFIILTVSIFAELLFYFKESVDKDKIKSILNGYRKWIFVFICLGLLCLGIYPFIRDNIKAKDNNSYPEKAVEFLKTLPFSENLLNNYGWGGYLIWNLPERKVFIDGRMPSWRENGQFVFGDYIKLMQTEGDTEQLLLKYNIKIVLLNKNIKDQAEKYMEYTEKPKNQLLKFFEEKKWICKIFGICIPSKNIYNELINLNWRISYQDDIAIILEKN